MKTLSIFRILPVLALATMFLSACEDEDPVLPPDPVQSAYLVHLRTGSAGQFADYILTEDNIMDGQISATGRGVEQTGWRYSAYVANTLLSVGYYDDNNAIGYGINDNGEIFEKGRFVFETTLDLFSSDIDGTLLAMEVPRSGFADRVLHVIDGENVAVTRKVSHPIYENHSDSLAAWPTALVVRGNELFVPFYTLHTNGSFATPKTDSAYVAVYSYPGLEFQRYIADDRMGPIGIYGNQNGMIQTENGDLYAYSSASNACGFTTQDKNSGILRIKAGESEFDPNYHFDVEAATGNKLAYFQYVGNGKAVGRLITDDSGLWHYYGTSDICELVIIDLESETITPISGIPSHKGQYASMLIEDGKVMVNITTESDASVYQIDPEAATATKGASIDGREIHSMVRLQY